MRVPHLPDLAIRYLSLARVDAIRMRLATSQRLKALRRRHGAAPQRQGSVERLAEALGQHIQPWRVQPVVRAVCDSCQWPTKVPRTKRNSLPRSYRFR